VTKNRDAAINAGIRLAIKINEIASATGDLLNVALTAIETCTRKAARLTEPRGLFACSRAEKVQNGHAQERRNVNSLGGPLHRRACSAIWHDERIIGFQDLLGQLLECDDSR
jgi:hypothetical protein